MPLDMNLFSVLPLPQCVPEGALNSTGVRCDNNEQLLRSCRKEPLAAQVAALRDDAATVQFELDSPSVDGYLATCDRANLFKESSYRVRAHEHPAWRAGLAAAGEVVLAKRGALNSRGRGCVLREEAGGAPQAALKLRRSRPHPAILL